MQMFILLLIGLILIASMFGRHFWYAAFCVTLLTVAALVVNAQAEKQTRVYDSRGNSVGTAVPQGQGSVRYYDRRGNSLGTSTTTGNTTTFYGPGGNVTGRSVGPSHPGTAFPRSR